MESPINFLKNIESQPADSRKNIILNFIKEFDSVKTFSVKIQEFQHKQNNAANIIVSISGNSENTLVIGAHYDIWPKSGGINDNGAAVFILLQLIKYILPLPKLKYTIDFVFFDLEENHQLGAKEYLKNVDKSKIVSMINLDMCGIGDYILFNETSSTSPQLSELLETICIQEGLKYQILANLPPGDEIPFQKEGIPAVSVAIVPHDTIPVVNNLAIITRSKGFNWLRIKAAFKFMFDMIKGYPVLKTMHSKEDTIETISVDSIVKVYHAISLLITQIVDGENKRKK